MTMPTLPTRVQIEAAGELSWEPRPQAAHQVTIHAMLDGFGVTVTTALHEVRSATRQLQEMGAVNVISPPTRPPARAPKPIYQVIYLDLD